MCRRAIVVQRHRRCEDVAVHGERCSVLRGRVADVESLDPQALCADLPGHRLLCPGAGEDQRAAAVDRRRHDRGAGNPRQAASDECQHTVGLVETHLMPRTQGCIGVHPQRPLHRDRAGGLVVEMVCGDIAAEQHRAGRPVQPDQRQARVCTADRARDRAAARQDQTAVRFVTQQRGAVDDAAEQGLPATQRDGGVVALVVEHGRMARIADLPQEINRGAFVEIDAVGKQRPVEDHVGAGDLDACKRVGCVTAVEVAVGVAVEIDPHADEP